MSLSAELDGLQMGMPLPFTGFSPASRSCHVLQLQPGPFRVIFPTFCCFTTPAQTGVSVKHCLHYLFSSLSFTFPGVPFFRFSIHSAWKRVMA